MLVLCTQSRFYKKKKKNHFPFIYIFANWLVYLSFEHFFLLVFCFEPIIDFVSSPADRDCDYFVQLVCDCWHPSDFEASRLSLSFTAKSSFFYYSILTAPTIPRRIQKIEFDVSPETKMSAWLCKSHLGGASEVIFKYNITTLNFL